MSENHQGYSDIQGWSVEGACDTLWRLESGFNSSQRLQKSILLEASGSTIHPVHSSISPKPRGVSRWENLWLHLQVSFWTLLSAPLVDFLAGRMGEQNLP